MYSFFLASTWKTFRLVNFPSAAVNSTNKSIDIENVHPNCQVDAEDFGCLPRPPDCNVEDAIENNDINLQLVDGKGQTQEPHIDNEKVKDILHGKAA